MNVFQTHAAIVEDYATYIRSFLQIADQNIRSVVEQALDKGTLWPEALLQFNPSFEMFGSVADVTAKGLLHPDLRHIFKGYFLYRHQTEAIGLGTAGRDFIVTSGTGSGKSLTYLGTVFHHLLSNPNAKGVVAIIVYPMNALINSQFDEIRRYKENFEQATGKSFPISFGQYTGQEKEDARQKMRESPPQILLTNYMMLELLLTRIRERNIRDGIYENLRYLVFDELHTYRGRQGADVALLTRRIQARCINPVVCIGTSATMVSVGSFAEQRTEVAKVASKLFGKTFGPDQIINETLARSLEAEGRIPSREALSEAIANEASLSGNEAELKLNPVAIWLENAIALEFRDGYLVRGKPREFEKIAEALGDASGLSTDRCRSYLQGLLQWISVINKQLQDNGIRYTLLPFKLHQFISQTGSVYTTLDQDENRFITLEPGVYRVDDGSKKPIYPSVFSRASGHAFICVSRQGNRLEPREFRVSSDDDQEATDGYLIIGEDLWDPLGDLELLPEAWVRQTKSGPVPDSKKKAFFPTKLYFNELGECSESKPLKWWG